MKPQLKLEGWVTRDSDDWLFFHTGEPYAIDTVTTNHRDAKHPEVREERIWRCRDKTMLLKHDTEKEHPGILVNEPRKASIELWMEE